MTPKDHVTVGQSFEYAGDDGGVYTVTEVHRTYNRVDGELWYITLMCVVSPGPWYRAGALSHEVSRDGTLRNSGYRRIG